ncbi:hypothetical protein HBI09_059680 [Parastagonospora nodorum]|nr:hypothetical protein HBI09_059680 [Parastagonospora nodorum]KAH5009002.1 hypothetical protein HBI77_097370 [Parastagonospora nodorum]KAH5330433.1 hypothetical protein HBI50_066960 [Parastagonospora nodorum]
MSDSDDETSSYRSGFVTPPLSPSKTVDTEGWFSPRTPGSPRKIRSCLLSRNICADEQSPFFTPPASPTKSKSTFHLGALTVPELPRTTDRSIPITADNDSPTKRCTRSYISRSSSPSSSTSARMNSLSSPSSILHPQENSEVFSVADPVAPNTERWLEPIRRTSYRTVSDSITAEATRPCSFNHDQDVVIPSLQSQAPHITIKDITDKQSLSMTNLRRLPHRSSSSPLRPSQWAIRGGLSQSPRRGQAFTPDRYIACRRPPAVTRESFELNKPDQRREADQADRGSRPTVDPFSRRLRRSGRLNDELNGLREAHSLLNRRVSARRRNTSLLQRRNFQTTGARQISAGAVWNVGGPSAVSDTVTAVSTGRNGVLGSGTNAPLYTSTFLNRADPEAELAAYERRLALALDVDQTDRILQHSPLPTAMCKSMQNEMAKHAKPAWRDGAWIKDGVILSLSTCASIVYFWVLLTIQ